ncbi:hypothetical protein BYT27DRAFT_7142990 [Phlegmacium glaucopus]|nr:hypothetical protein BYT27DRAFT_7142990 [Phlegmacium glaucopus]
MFKTAATKIAHNSTIPALGGNQDLRPLQDLITAEKAVLISLQKLSVDYSKASEALRTWGLSEGDDLGDILSASTSILNHFSSALSQYAAHGHSMRDQLKAIRTREESLDELKRRQRTVIRKAEDAEKKLGKMSPEHKNLVMQTETLNRLRDDIRTMSSGIMSEEAALGDFKRTATRMWMGLKFGGLLECCEKGTIAGEYGKLTISEVSEEITQPGLPRSFYYGHSKVEGLVAEAHRCVNEVTLSTVPSVGFRDRRQYERKSSNAQASFNSPQVDYGEPPKGDPWLSGDGKATLQDDTSSYFQTPVRPFASSGYSEKNNSSTLSLTTSLGNQPYAPPYQPQVSQGPANSSLSQPLSLPQKLGVHEGVVDDFGVNVRSTVPVDISNAGSRFATFPVKARPPGSSGGYSLQDPPSLGGRNLVGDSSFSASIAEALHGKEDSKADTLSPWNNRFNGGSESSIISTARATEGSYNQSTTSWGGRSDNDPPPFEGLPPVSITAPLSQIPADNSKRSSGQFSPLPLPPPGAAPPDLANPWNNSPREGSIQAPSHSRQPSHLSESDDALLAYMTTADGDSVIEESPPNTATPYSVPPATSTTTTTALSATTTNDEDQSLGRHKRFGAMEDVGEDVENHVSLEKEQAANTRAVGTSPSSLMEGQHTTAPPDKGSGDSLRNGETNTTENHSAPSQHVKPASRRVLPPALPMDEDEKALNAAAAREISLELVALKDINNHLPPLPSEVDQRSQPDPTPDFDRGRPMMASTPRFNDYTGLPTTPTTARARDASPMAAAAPLPERNLPPHPYAELNPPVGYSPYETPQSYVQQPYHPPPVSPAQAYAQSYQQQQQQQQQQPSSYVPYAQPQAPDMRNTVPPRFQALNNNMPVDPQVPPRFQGSSSPIVNVLPPRFQTNYTSQVSAPGGVNISADQQQRDDVIPPISMYPRPPASTNSFNNSNTSLPLRNQPVQFVRGPTPPLTANAGTRTISAAAFKRPVQRNPGSIDTDSMFGKMLPSTPSAQGSETVPGQPQYHRKQTSELEDDYDYISAYVNHGDGAR